MTVIEAINILELENPFLGGDDYKLLSEAIDMAIEALKAQEVKTDLISRQAAIDAAIEATDEWDGGFSRSRDEIITMKLQTLPSAQPDNRLERIADIVEGTIDHLDRDDAMDMLYQIKEVLK